MDFTGFISTINTLCEITPDLKLKILTNTDSTKVIEKCNEQKQNIILHNLSICILDPKYRDCILLHTKPWLLEILSEVKSVIGSYGKRNFCTAAHSALCVCLGHIESDDVQRFAKQYFQEAPSPFYSLTQTTEPPASKKLKLSHDIPVVTELQILEATYNLLLYIGVEISNRWEFASLLKYFNHEEKKIRWFACHCVALFLNMSEVEKKSLLAKYVKDKLQVEFATTRRLDAMNSVKCVDVPNAGDFASQYTCHIGRIILPLYKGTKNKSKNDTLILLPSTQQNLENIALGISSNRPVLVEGLVGSGKTNLIVYLASQTGRTKAPLLSKIQLSDQTDSKTLIGTYRCTANPGEFIWQAGSVTQAVLEGYWLLLEDIDFAPLDVISLLIPLLESRTLPVPGLGNIKAHPDFQIFATRRILPAGCRMRIGSANLIEKLWTKVPLCPLSYTELKQLICENWPELETISKKLVEVYMILSSGQHGEETDVKKCRQCGTVNLTSAKTSGRFVSVRDLMKWCSRMVSHITENELNVRAFQEAVDCFCSAVSDSKLRYNFALHIGSHLNINEALVNHFLNKDKPEINSKVSHFVVGTRGRLLRLKRNHISLNTEQTTFSKTRLSSCLLEKVTVAVMKEEPVLLVGETGTGKTSIIQYLARHTNHSLRVINMNQQSDSSDLLGGFKPVEIRSVVAPLKQEFEELFVSTFSAKKNTKFLGHIMNTFARQKWDDLFLLIKHSKEKAMVKLNEEKKDGGKEAKGLKNSEGKKTMKEIARLNQQWLDLESKLETITDQVKKVKSSLAFAYIEGSLVKAVKGGEWVLLDEINLASADTLESLSGLLESSSGSLTLHERGDSKPIQRHSDFRLFACMNPATDVGKKELPAGLRNRFSEFFVEEIRDVEDLKQIVYEYLKDLDPSPKQIIGIVKFYIEVKKLATTLLNDATGHKPHFSLRTLCRALIVARKNPCKNFNRSLFEAFSLAFLTQLDQDSYQKVAELVQGTFKAKTNTPLPAPEKESEFVPVEGFWVPIGNSSPVVPEKYILTPTVRSNLKDLVRIVSIGRFPVLLQGDTSVGKTSLITYLAKLTGNHCVRINNHQHTDLQEYVGSYAPDHTGKLVFKEGILVQAMRNGNWVILDELNLAPSDVLEALNRLLDDNRELFIPEIETVVKAHPKFMLFATQNPPGLYGGRQVLSRAFRNRFVELHFDVIPPAELKVILKERCDIPDSLSKKMVLVLQDLQNRRRTSNLCQGKQSFITLRDLFRWAERYRLAPKINTFYDWDQHMADEGYLVLAGKIRVEEETKAIVDVLKKRLGKDVKVDNLFEISPLTSPVTKSILENLDLIKGFEHIVWTFDMRRLFVLISKAMIFCEPVLLVGETGCGKTTVCQMIASMKEQKLFTVNCHMHTEGADFLGGLRPVRDRNSKDDRLFEWVDGPLIQALRDGGMFLADEISLADDSVLERLNSVLEPERTLVLAEKAGDEWDENLETIVAHDQFRLVGTMNPGGDYGKKELSPALRNRLTEIWCPKVEIRRSTTDVKLIIKHNIEKSLNQDTNIEHQMVLFLKYFTETELGKKITVSIRDVLSWVLFINKIVTNSTVPIDIGMAYIHGACLILLDGLGSGTSGCTVQNWRTTREKALKCLCSQAQQMSQKSLDPSSLIDVKKFVIRNDDEKFGIEPFTIPKGYRKTNSPTFAFEAPMTCLNLLRLLRGLQLSRPILLEGSPGVGKTSLVVALAKASGNDIVRINLSEQTDVSDLFGADLPVEGGEGGRFAWRDGPLLQALKDGSWVVLDELNLASQSVLEGLNACFDHRGEIFIPELNKTFVVQHQLTKIFACQNPQCEGGARKGLPKSFLNRFTQVHVEPLSSFDLEFILGAIHSYIPREVVSMMVKFNDALVEDIQERKIWGTKGGPWELNLRDMFRWCEMMMKREKRTESGFNPGDFVDFIYADRMRTESDKEEVYRVYSTIFPEDQYPLYRKSGTFRISDQSIQVGRAVLQRKTAGIEWKEDIDCNLFILHGQTPYLESLINSINMNWMTLLVGPSSEGKSSLVWLLSRLAGQRLETMSVNSHMDVTELLGGFEQADYGRRLSELVESLQQIVWREVRRNLLKKKNMKVANEFLSLWKQLSEIKDAKIRKTTTEEVRHFVSICQAVEKLIDCLEQNIPSSKIKKLTFFRDTCNTLCKRVQSTSTVSGGGTFEWVDSPLVKAVRNGYWLLIDGVNLCSPSVLDRLNGLLEPGGVLTMSERGVVSSEVPVITPHKNFRLFLTMDPQHGEISRAMRNRGMEVYVLGMWQNSNDVRSLLLSHGLKDEDLQKFLTKVYSDICQGLTGPEKPSISCLAQSAALTKRLMELGQPLYTAVELSLRLAYGRNSSRMDAKNKVQQIINNSLQNFEKAYSRRLLSNTSVSNICCLNSKTLLQCSSLGLPVQLATLMNSSSLKLLPSKTLVKAGLPESLPCSGNDFGVTLFHILSTLPLQHWNTFIVALENCTKRGKIIADVSKMIVSDSSVTFQLLDNICDGELAADPRFSFTALCMKVTCHDTVSSLANKALIGLELKLEEAISSKRKNPDKRKSKIEKSSHRADTVLELSVKISKGLLGEKMIYHPSLRYLAHLLHSVTALIKDLSDSTEVDLTDLEYFRLRESLTWRRRLLVLCDQTVSRDNFHKFLPELIFHWKNLQDMLLDQIPPTWDSVLPEDLGSVVCKLKEAFLDNCSPLHNLVPEMRDHIGFPSPFTSQSSAAEDVKLYEISKAMTPYIGYDNEKEVEKVVFLASEGGSEIKTRLLNIAFDIESTSASEDLEDLEKTLNEILAKEFSKSTSYLSSVKLWPILDYFVSKQLNLTNVFGLSGVPLSDCRDVLAKASSIPVLLITNFGASHSLAAVMLYLFNISNCSALRPGSWLNYDNLIVDDNDKITFSTSWEGEKNFVLSQMGCNLVYKLLCGFSKPEKEEGFMSVGNHSEWEIQLSKIRKTLWENWMTLSNPSNNYSSRFKDSINSFTANLLRSLLKTLKGTVSTGQNNLDICTATEELLVLGKDVLGTEGQILLQEIKTLGDKINSDDAVVYTQLGVFAGLLQSWLLSHIEPLDPAQQRALLLSYYEEELSKLEDSLTLFKWIKILTYSHSIEDLHPHYKFYVDAIDDLKRKIASISQNVAFRPEISQYSEIVHEINHFMKTLFLPSRVCELVKGLTTNVRNISDILRQCEVSLRSCDNFIKNLLYSYPLYRDLTVPVLHGVVIACESLRALMVLMRNKDLSMAIGKDTGGVDFDEVLSSMLYFPSLRKGESGGFLCQKVKYQKCISHLIRENSPTSSYYVNQCESLGLRASFYDLFNHVAAEKFFTKDSFSFMKDLLEKIVAMWREQEREKKRKAQEEESLFLYKPRNLAISETEEEEIQREYLELFPDYSNEFNDLEYLADGDDDDDVEEHHSNEESEEGQMLTDEYLNEVIEVHRILISNFVETSWMVSHKEAETKPITPVILRTNQVQLLLKLIGPYGTQNVDFAAMGSLVISNYVSSSVAKNSVNISMVQKHFNYYHDSKLEETLKVRPLLKALDSKADDLLAKWPSHPSLRMIKKVIDRVLNFAVTSPLIRLVIGLEMVLEKAQEWEKNAHRGVSLMTELTPITEQVIEWRKMELKAWRSCLDMISEKVFNEANKFWPHLYDTFLSVDAEKVNDLIQALKQFMESSLIGDYERRLQVLKAFHCHLCLESKHCIDSCEILEKLIAMTWNFFKYYQQFLPVVDETLKREKKPIEKKVKEFIKILKWNDVNFFSVRDSVIKSRRTLHRHMRDWEKVLRRPFSPLLLDQTDDAEGSKGIWDSEKVSLSMIIKPTVPNPADVEVIPVMADENLLVNRLPTLTKRSFDLINKAIERMPYTDNIEGIEEMTLDILSGYNDLILATSKAENMGTKEERVKSSKDVANRKKKALSNLFKSLHHQGISYTKGNSLWKEDDIDSCLIVPPLDIKVALREVSDLKISSKCLQSCDKYFYKSIGRQALLLKSLHQAHKDLNPEDIKRLKGVSSHFLLLLRQMRGVIPHLCSTVSEVDYIVKEIEKATVAYVPVCDEFCVWWEKTYSLMNILSLNLEEEIKVFETYPDCNSLLEILPKTHSFTELDVQNVLSNFKNIFSELTELKEYSLKANVSLGNDYVKLPSLENIEDLASIFIRLSHLKEKLSSCIKMFDENFNGTTSLSKPFIDWIHEWKETFDQFFNWKSNLNPIGDQDYVSSENIEICLVKILKCIEELYKHHYQEASDATDDVDVMTRNLISQGIVHSLVSDYDRLRGNEIKQALMGLISELNTNSNTSVLIALKSMKPLLRQYLIMNKNVVTAMAESFRSLSKLHSILLGIFQQIATKGFCRSEETEEEQDGEGGATQFQDSGPGLSGGDEGTKDVSERYESEDQLESALQEGEKEEEGNKDLKEEDGVEISHDFEGGLQNIEHDEEDENKSESDGDEENEDLDKQMGETEKDADKLDEKLWGDEEEEEEDDEKKDKQDEHGPGDGETTESQIVAKDDNKNHEENENKDKKKKELEVMEEDRREEVEEEEETTYEDNYKDTFGGEDHPDNNDEEEPMDLPDDINLEGGDKDQSDEDPDPEMNPEIEEKGLFPEEEKDPKEKETGEGDDDPTGEEKESDHNREEGEKNVEEQMDVDDEDKSDSDRQRMSEELEKKEGEDKPEDGEENPVPSHDVAATTEAQAADMETKEAVKDKTKNNPENATGAQPEEDKDSKQEEQGEMGEQTEDVSGVGQSDSRTKEEAHVGETSALTNDEDAKQKMEDQHQPRRPGDPNQTKTLGEVEKEIHRGLVTSKEKRYKENEESEEGADSETNDKTENEPENKDSNLYEHIQKADERFDKQTIDSGTREEAKLVPAPAEEEETKEDEEPEGIVDTLMETENEEEEEKRKEETRKRQNELEGTEGADIKRRKREPDPEIDNKINDYETVVEGEAIQELTVQRPISNEIFTQLDEEEVAAIFSEDPAILVEDIKHAEDGDVKKGSEQWEELEGRVSSLALQLCEQLRLILEPTEASKLRGDYRTGKRLNMRKVIPYIASQFRKDKIWLRRSQPSKRSYQVLLAVDDSQSMSVLNAGNLARESVALVAKALTLLEVGEVGVISFGEETKVLHPLHKPFSDYEGGKIFGNLSFSQTKSNFDQMLKDSVALFTSARGGQTVHSETAQLLLILSEGQNHACTKEVKAAVRAAREARVFIIFLVLDAHDNKYSFCDGLAFVDGKIQSRIETFPFPFFIVVRDLEGLPDAIATALRQWFELVTSDVH